MQLPAEQFVIPNYGRPGQPGTTIANVPATLAALLDVPFQGLPALPDQIWQPLLAAGPVKRIAVIIIDAMGQNLVGKDNTSLPLVPRATVHETITSIFPSTTVNCLSCIWTGHAPAQHSLVGLRLLFPQYGVVGQMIHMSPNFHRAPDALVNAGVDLETFLQVPGVGEQFGAAGVPVHSYKGRDIVNSSLSKMYGRGLAENKGAFSFSDMLWQMRTAFEETIDQSLIAVGYWPTIDTLSHAYGPRHPAVAGELAALMQQIETLFVDALSPAARKDTVLIMIADHGQLLIDQQKKILLTEHPDLENDLLIHGGGEPRTPYLYARQGRAAAVQSYLETHFSDLMVVRPSNEVLAAGLLGPEPHAPEVLNHRIGDLIGLMRPNAIFVNQIDEKLAQRMRGKHGGLSADEMYVPFLGFRL